MSSLLFIDVESTGFGDNAAVIEIALIPVINGEKHESFVSYIRPHEGCLVSPKAFEINGIDPKKMWDFPEAKDVIKQIVEFIDKHETVFVLGGHKISFDRRMLFKLFCRNGHYSDYTVRFSPDDICTERLARRVITDKRNKPEGFSLGALCKFFNITLENAHSALPDIEATVALYEKLVALTEPAKRAVQNLTYQQQRTKYMAIDYCTLNPEGDCYLHNKAMKDPEAMRFILNELWRITQCHETTSSIPQENVTHGESWPESWDAH